MMVVFMKRSVEMNNQQWPRLTYVCIPDFEKIAKEYMRNCKIGHINANSITGHKFCEIRHWLRSGFFDILVISETKSDQTFANSQFMTDGFRFLRIDRNIHGGGLMLYIWSDIPFKFNRSISTEQREKYGTECIACEVKVGRSWMTTVGIYRPPSLKKPRWEFEMNNLFEMFTFRGNDVLFLGDFNCDMIHPDKAPKDGRCLMDLLDVYHLKNLVTQSTRVTKSPETLFDLILTNKKRRALQTGVVDTQISDHSLVYTIMRVTLPRLSSRKIAFRSFKKFDRDKFVEDFSVAPFHIMDIFDDPDDMLYVFESLYNDILDEHSPLKYADMYVDIMFHT